jgi:hypothetical protein
MKTFINLTPHAVKLNSGVEFPASGTIARVTSSFTAFDEDGVAKVVFGEVQNLPEPAENILYIVSALVLAASKRADLVAPATGHPEAVRNEKGQIVSVPGFVR